MSSLSFCSRCNGIRSECECNHRLDVRESQKTSARGYGWDWTQLSKRYRTENPFCQVCYDKGKLTGVDHVHHIQPIKDAPQLRLDWNNLQSVCKACHIDVERGGHGVHEVDGSTKTGRPRTSPRRIT